MPAFLWRLIIGIVPVVAVAQPSPSKPHLDLTVIGTVTGISGHMISVNSDGRIVAITVDRNAEIWKGKMFHDLSPVQIGDDLSARCRPTASGKPDCQAIWLNIVNYFGVITKVQDDNFEMLTNPEADPDSAYVKDHKAVRVDSETLFNDSAKDDLRPGRYVQMVGLDLRNGTIRATRVTVYEGKRPVRMGNGKVMPVTGPPK